MVEDETTNRANEAAAKRQPLAAFRFTTTITVRFCEIDGNRHTNEVSYFVYMEHVRMLYLEHLGLFELREASAARFTGWDVLLNQ